MEKPILFNAEMVRAVLDGRKTQTRRILKVQPDKDGLAKVINGPWVDTSERLYRSPFGQPGDRLWVREAFRVHSRATDVATIAYRASERQSWTQQTRRVPIGECAKPVSAEAWTPSIHMPRWASRITLEITGVRVERLWDISEQDAVAEGIECKNSIVDARYEAGVHREYFAERFFFKGGDDEGYVEAGDAYAYLWESIYGSGSWLINPWVWVVEFKMEQQP